MWRIRVTCCENTTFSYRRDYSRPIRRRNRPSVTNASLSAKVRHDDELRSSGTIPPSGRRVGFSFMLAFLSGAGMPPDRKQRNCDRRSCDVLMPTGGIGPMVDHSLDPEPAAWTPRYKAWHSSNPTLGLTNGHAPCRWREITFATASRIVEPKSRPNEPGPASIPQGICIFSRKTSKIRRLD